MKIIKLNCCNFVLWWEQYDFIWEVLIEHKLKANNSSWFWAANTTVLSSILGTARLLWQGLEVSGPLCLTPIQSDLYGGLYGNCSWETLETKKVVAVWKGPARVMAESYLVIATATIWEEGKCLNCTDINKNLAVLSKD